MRDTGELGDAGIALPAGVPAADFRLFRGSEAIGHERDGIDAVCREFLEHFDGGIGAVEGGKYGGEIDAALEEEFQIRSVGGRIGERGEAGFKFAGVLAGDGAEGVEGAEEKKDCEKEEDAEESEPAHG